jgi:hypothetical protein
MPPRVNADKSQQLEAAILEQAAAIFQIERKLVAAKASVAELAVELEEKKQQLKSLRWHLSNAKNGTADGVKSLLIPTVF